MKKAKRCICIVLAAALSMVSVSCNKENQGGGGEDTSTNSSQGGNTQEQGIWTDLTFSQEEIQRHMNIFAEESSPGIAIYDLFQPYSDRVLNYTAEGESGLVIEEEDEKSAVATVSYRDGGVEEVRVEKDEEKGIWIPTSYRALKPKEYEELFVQVKYEDGKFYYDEIEWIDSEDKERIEQLKALGVNDMGFENGYYVYNEKVEKVPLELQEGAEIYVLSSELEGFEFTTQDEWQKRVEEGYFYGYHDIYVKDGKVGKIYEVYVP